MVATGVTEVSQLTMGKEHPSSCSFVLHLDIGGQPLTYITIVGLHWALTCLPLLTNHATKCRRRTHISPWAGFECFVQPDFYKPLKGNQPNSKTPRPFRTAEKAASTWHPIASTLCPEPWLQKVFAESPRPGFNERALPLNPKRVTLPPTNMAPVGRSGKGGRPYAQNPTPRPKLHVLLRRKGTLQVEPPFLGVRF